MVYKLLKILYDLKQSPCFWYKKLSSFFFKEFGLKQININYSIFVINASQDGPVISTFVNDIKIITPKKSGMIDCIKSKLTSVFSMVDINLVSFYLDLKVEYNQKNRKIKLSQPAYIDKVFSKFYLDKAYPVNTLMKEYIILKQKTDRQVNASEKKQY